MSTGRPDPFTVTRADGVLTLTLDTPGSPVNIFDNNAAAQLVAVMESVDPATTRAVVLRSAKRDSFLNGVGLLMAMAANDVEGARQLTTLVRRSYRAVAECPVPTFAAVAGSCFGCGLELSLRCDYRIAADVAATQFYMTEVNDYLFLPIFEGTLRLPLLLGLEPAADLLLFRRRWSAPQALESGLVDAVLPWDDFAVRCDDLVRQVAASRNGTKRPRPAGLHGPLAKHSIEASTARIRERIRRYPPSHQELFEACLDLMLRAVRAGAVRDEERELEIRRAGESCAAPMAKKALSFFFTRQIAHKRALRRSEIDQRRPILCFDGERPRVAELREELATRRVTGVELRDHADASDLPEAPTSEAVLVRLVDDAEAEPPPGDVRVAVLEPGAASPPSGWHVDAVLHSPLSLERWAPLELACRGEPSEELRLFYRHLDRAGYSVVLSSAGEVPATYRFLTAYVTPLLQFIAAGGLPGEVNAALRAFGFVRWPHHLFASAGWSWLTPWVAEAMARSPAQAEGLLERLCRPELSDAPADSAITDSLCLSLWAAAAACRRDGTLSHPACADLLARDMLDFPLEHGSLGTYMSRDRVRQLLSPESGARPLLLAGPRDWTSALGEYEAYA